MTYRVTLMCDSCPGLPRERLTVEDGDLETVAGRWEADHAGHQAMVVVSADQLMTPPPLACPTCPVCGSPPEFILAGAVQAFCSNDACDVIIWNPSETLDANLTNAGRATETGS